MEGNGRVCWKDLECDQHVGEPGGIELGRCRKQKRFYLTFESERLFR